MKLLFCDDIKVDSFQLPKEVKDYFTINYYYNKDSVCETITLEAVDGNWKMDANVNMIIADGTKKPSNIMLKEYNYYSLYFADLNKYVMLHIVPDFEESIDIDVHTIPQITIGNTNTNVLYKTELIGATQAVIQRINNYFVIKNTNPQNNCVYVNKKLIQGVILNFGDVIFINGLRIIWMGKYFKINNPNNKVSVSGLRVNRSGKVRTIDYTPPTQTERNTKLFTENQLFFHTPRLQRKIELEEVKIDEPPEEDRNERMPMVLTMGATAVMGLTSAVTSISAVQGLLTGSGNKFGAILQLVVGFSMLISCILFPTLTDKWEKKRAAKKEKRRQERYSAYLDTKEENINKIIKKQESILHENNITLDEVSKRIQIKSESLWSREIIDDDFLTIRLGLGNLPAQVKINAPEEHFFMYDDNLRDRVLKIASEEREVKNVPITISMVKNKITPFILNTNFKQDYINSIMLQLMYYYSGVDLKIVLLTNELNKSKWEYVKYLPHNFSNVMDKRFFATNEDEMAQISIYLDQIYEKRLAECERNDDDTRRADDKADLYKNYSEYYLIITDDFKTVKNLPIIKRVLDSNKNIGFSLMIFGDSLKNLPSRLEKFIDIEENVSAIYSKENDKQIRLSPEYRANLNLKEYAKIVGNIPVLMKNAGNNLPTSLNFLDIYRAGRVDHLNILQRWHDNDPTISLNTVLGVKSDGKPIGLDLHEKYHGPHGLIAGTTGSGKSEFIITYVLSMAVNYSPEEVQFVLIDYKGGGLAGAFENREKGIKIPHLAGTITNLDTAEMNRTLVSINSELKRRQRKFNEARDALGESTIDIYKYQKLYREGKVKDPISHLFIICDEFAELKQQQPEFMEELVSTSRIGRSLGVHLILATQKPTGVVDDQIWSNSKFKVCLKVQTTGDSNEMLKKPDAAYIKEAGRFYLQVGNDELYELGQSAWAGAKYVPVDRVLNKIDDSIDFISNDGVIYKSVVDEIKQSETVNLGEQLTNVVKYLYNIGIRENKGFNYLWLPSISKEIYLNDILQKYKPTIEKYKFDAFLGEYDKPAKQEQGLYKLNINSSNTLISGIPNSGKENYISTLIYSLCAYHTPEELNLYILDFGSESLGAFNKFPHVGDFITSDEPDKVITQFQYLENQIRKRKELFSEYQGSYDEYCKNSGKTLPLIVTVLNAYESFMESCGQYDDALIRLIREGSKYGVVFILSTVSMNSVRTTVQEYFTNKVMLQVNDPFDYQFILGAQHGQVPAKAFGRGMTKIDDEVCEFQTAYITLNDNIIDLVKQTGKKFAEYYNVKAPEIKIIPKVIKLDSLFKFAKNLNRIPVGYARDDGDLTSFDFTKNNSLILGKNVTSDISFMASVIDLIDTIKGIKFNVFDFASSVSTDGNMSYYSLRYQEALNEIANDPKIFTVNLFIGIGNYKEVMDNQEEVLFNKIMNNINNYKNQVFIMFDNIDRFRNIANESWYNNINKNDGIWVGSDIDEQDVFVLNELTNYDVEEKLKDKIYVIENNKYKVVKGVGGKEDMEVDFFG